MNHVKEDLGVPAPKAGHKRVVVIGGGFGGIRLVQALRKLPLQVVMLDKNNYHKFQPLLYQVATAGLEPNTIASPLRKLSRNSANYHFRLTEVEQILPDQYRLRTDNGTIRYDYLVIATGAKDNFFGQKDLEANTFALKEIPGALDIRTTILQNFEKAMLAGDDAELQRLMDYVVVGGGPTGVEVAGALSELRDYILPKDYPELNFREMDIYLVEANDRLLKSMSEKSSLHALEALGKMGVKVILNDRVKSYDGRVLTLGDGRQIDTCTVIWAAGVTPALIPGLKPQSFEQGNRIRVDAFNRVVGEEDIFAIGDVATMQGEKLPKGHPMLAPVAMQQGVHLGRNFRRLVQGEPLKPFKYWDKGTMSTIGRHRAVADLPFMHLSGWPAWAAWLLIHLFFLIGFRNKLLVVLGWTWSYFTYQGALRLLVRPKAKEETKAAALLEV